MENIKTKIISLLSALSVFILAFLPVIVSAVQSDAGKTGITYECVNGECDFKDLIAATKYVINYATKYALFFSVIVIAYAGFLYMTAGDKPANITKANGMFQKVAIGIAWVMAAWLVVNMITNALLGNNIVQFIQQYGQILIINLLG